jgi:HEAT repeat protein
MLPPNESHDSIDRSEIYGLATIAGHANTRRDLRIKAIRALARIPDQNAIRVLGEMALWERDEELRSEAYRSLGETFGDDLPEVLESIRQELTGGWVESTSEADKETRETESQMTPGFEANPRLNYARRNQSAQVEGTPLWLLWVLIGLVVLGGLVYFLLLR